MKARTSVFRRTDPRTRDIYNKAALVLDQIEAVEASNQRRRCRQRQQPFLFATTSPFLRDDNNEGDNHNHNITAGEKAGSEVSTPQTVATTPSTVITTRSVLENKEEDEDEGGDALFDDLTSCECEDEDEYNSFMTISDDGDNGDDCPGYEDLGLRLVSQQRLQKEEVFVDAINFHDEEKEEVNYYHYHSYCADGTKTPGTITTKIPLTLSKQQLMASLQQCYKSLVAVQENAILQRRQLELELSACQKELSDCQADNHKRSIIQAQLEKELHEKRSLLAAERSKHNAAAITAGDLERDHFDEDGNASPLYLCVEKHLNSLLEARQVAVEENYELKRMLLQTCCSACLRELPFRRGKIAATKFSSSNLSPPTTTVALPTEPATSNNKNPPSRPTWQQWFGGLALKNTSSSLQQRQKQQHSRPAHATPDSIRSNLNPCRLPPPTVPQRISISTSSTSMTAANPPNNRNPNQQPPLPNQAFSSEEEFPLPARQQTRQLNQHVASLDGQHPYHPNNNSYIDKVSTGRSPITSTKAVPRSSTRLNLDNYDRDEGIEQIESMQQNNNSSISLRLSSLVDMEEDDSFNSDDGIIHHGRD